MAPMVSPYNGPIPVTADGPMVMAPPKANRPTFAKGSYYDLNPDKWEGSYYDKNPSEWNGGGGMAMAMPSLGRL
jgi:hypothetical protein